MTLHQLRVLLAVADMGSVRLAAQHLHVSQPAVSGAVSALEREMGAKLVRPLGRGIELTLAGSTLAGAVRSGLQSIDQAVRVVSSIDEPGAGPVRIASIATAAEQVVLPRLGAFRADYPHAAVSIEVGNRAMVWRRLGDLAVDLVVAGRPPDSLAQRVLGMAPNRLVVFGLRPERLGRREAVRALGQATWLLREEGSGTREATEELLALLGIDPPRMILGSSGAVLEAVAAGFGVALLPEDSVGPGFTARGIEPMACPNTPIERPWHLVCSSAVEISPTARLAVRALLSGEGGFHPTAQGRRLVGDRSGG